MRGRQPMKNASQCQCWVRTLDRGVCANIRLRGKCSALFPLRREGTATSSSMPFASVPFRGTQMSRASCRLGGIRKRSDFS